MSIFFLLSLFCTRIMYAFIFSNSPFSSWSINTCLLHIVMQIQDEVIVSDAERLRVTQSNVKMVLLFPLLSPPLCNVNVVLNFFSSCIADLACQFSNFLCSSKDIFKLILFLGFKECNRRNKFSNGVS